MGFVTPALLAGALLVAVPIVLHLVMRRRAQQLVFPALRFLQQRKTLNQHRLQLRHLLLLALRCAVIALLAFALARPTLRSAGAVAPEDRPIAAALVFDNSLRMSYVHENQTRLERAQELAQWLLGQLPTETPVVVVDRGTSYVRRDADRSAAELRVERLAPSSVVRPLADALQDAADWLRQHADHRGELYVFTDLAAAEWSADALNTLGARLRELPAASVYLIDVGVPQPRNLELGPLRLSAEEIAPGGLLQIDTELEPTGQLPHDEVTVELYTTDATGAAQKRGQQVVPIDRDGATPIEFSIAGLPLGTQQGYVRLVGGDPLAADDTRYFTVEVREPRWILLLAESQADALFLHEALAPSAAAGLVGSKFNCNVRQFAELAETPLVDYDAVCLVDPPPLPNPAWQKLTDYAQAGRGVGIFLGRNARRDPFNEPAPQNLLPAKLRWQSRDVTYLRPTATNHPALAELAALDAAVPWSEFPVFKFWELESPAVEVNVLAPFANGKPALLERIVGGGRVITMTTPVSDPAHREPWNLLPTGPDPWPFLALANGLAEYLSGSGAARLNYLAGQAALLPLAPDEQVTSYVLMLPGSNPVRQSTAPGQTDLSITTTEALGNYRVRAGGQREGLDRGFSVNAPTNVSRLERVDFATVAEALGRDRIHLARTPEEIEIRVGRGRVGRELFPALILAVALVLGVEHLLANRFYRDTA